MSLLEQLQQELTENKQTSERKELTSAAAQALAKAIEHLAQQVALLQQAIAHHAAPKRVVYDPQTGKATGIEPVQ